MNTILLKIREIIKKESRYFLEKAQLLKKSGFDDQNRTFPDESNV